jgi:hypothetical protein
MNWGRYARAHVRMHSSQGTIVVHGTEAIPSHGPYPPAAASLHIITAHNPAGTLSDPEANLEAHGRLVAELTVRGHEFWDAEGGDESWTHVEPSSAVLGMTTAEAREIGSMFGQEAIFEWTPHEWIVRACRGSRAASMAFESAYDDHTVALRAAAATLGLDLPLAGNKTLDRVLETTLHLRGESAEHEAREAHRLLVDYAESWRERIVRNKALADRYAQETSVARMTAAANARDAQRRMERERLRELHRAGWPTSWSKRQIEEWIGSGGTSELAQAFKNSGWKAKEVLEAARTTGISSLQRVPDGTKKLHRAFGDSLADIASGEWPAASPWTVLSVKRWHASGMRERWMGVQMDGQLRLDHWQRQPNGSGWVQSDPRWFEDALTAFRQLPELRTLHASAMNEYVVIDPGPTPVQLLEAMEVAPDGQETDPDSWDDELLDRWTDDEDLTREILSDNDGTPLRTTINGQQVATLRIEETSNLVLVDLDDEQITPLAELASFSWYSESGGAPISWNGGDSVVLIHPRLLQIRSWGDIERPTQLLPMPDTATELAALLAQWITEVDAEVPAAIALEPLDPDLVLDGQQRAAWRDRMECVTADLTLDVEPDVIQALQEHLTREASLYTAVRLALRDPLSPQGKRFAAALDDAAEDGVIGGVLYGGWLS